MSYFIVLQAWYKVLTCTCGGIHPRRVEPASPRHGHVSWGVSTPRSPVQALLHLLAWYIESIITPENVTHFQCFWFHDGETHWASWFFYLNFKSDVEVDGLQCFLYYFDHLAEPQAFVLSFTENLIGRETTTLIKPIVQPSNILWYIVYSFT